MAFFINLPISKLLYDAAYLTSCVVLCIVCFVLFYVLFLCKCALYYRHRVSTQLQLKNIPIFYWKDFHVYSDVSEGKILNVHLSDDFGILISFS